MISKYMEKQNEIFHKQNQKWGVHGHKWSKGVVSLAKKYNCETILDFGAGKQTLSKSLKGKFDIRDYDPGIPEISQKPKSADLVVCTHILEHVEPELLESTLKELYELTKKVILIAVDPGQSNKFLPDGRDSNLIQLSIKEWEKKISDYFKVQNIDRKEFNKKGIIKPTNTDKRGTFYGEKV